MADEEMAAPRGPAASSNRRAQEAPAQADAQKAQAEDTLAAVPNVLRWCTPEGKVPLTDRDLKNRSQWIFEQRMVGRSWFSIAAEVGLSPERVRQIYMKRKI